MTDVFMMKLDEIQPSQLFINSEKLSHVMRNYAPVTPGTLPPIPVKELRGKTVFTDGHTRALAAFLSGLSEVTVYRDEDDMDWEAYEICVDWCEEEGIRTIADLKDRIVPPTDYEELWLNRCAEMHRQLESERG